MENKKEWWVEGTKQCIEANLNSGSGMAIYYAMEHIKTLVAQQETEAIRRRDAELLEKVERFKNEIVLSPDIADKTKWNVLEWVIKLIKGE